MIQREQEEIAKYNELHGIQRPGGISANIPSNLLDAVTGSPKPSRPHSMLSYCKGENI